MNDDPQDSDTREQRLDEVIAEYLGALETGREPKREHLLARHPDLAEDLTKFLDQREQLQGVIRPAGIGGPPTPICPRCKSLLETREGDMTCRSCGERLAANPAAGDPFSVPSYLGRIEIDDVVGRGAFGVVYHGWDHELRREVAVKVLRNHRFAPPVTVKRFIRDAQILATLDHPGIVNVHQIGPADEIPYLVMEYVRGGTLAELIRNERGEIRADRPDPKQAVIYVAAVADALAHAHEKGVVHRDIKLSNILMSDGNLPKLTDFGLALWEDVESTVTRADEFIGTAAYMSLEQLKRPHLADGRSDVYSLGVVFYELLTGERPFVGSPHNILQQIESGEPRSPRALDERVPKDLETISLKCLEKDPDRRFETAHELAEELRRFLRGEPIRSRPVSRVERWVRWCRRKPGLAAAIALVALLLTAIAAVSVAWAIDSNKNTAKVEKALNESKVVRAEADLDRGLAEAERGDVGLGMLYMARSLETLPPGNEDLEWTIRTNLNAWRRELCALTNFVEPPPGKVLAFSPDGQSAWFVAPNNRTVRRWDLAMAGAVGPELVHDRDVDIIAPSPDGKRVACGGTRVGVRIWETATGRPLASPKEAPSVWGMTYAFDGDRLFIAIGENKGANYKASLNVWDGTNMRSLNMAFEPRRPIVMSAESNGLNLLAAGAGDKELRRWNITEGRSVDRFLRQPVTIKAIAASSDRTRILTGSDDRLARLWDAETHQLLAVLPHPAPVIAVGFARDGSTLLTATAGEAVRVWQNPNKDNLVGRTNLSGKLWAMASSPDGNFLLTGTDQVQVWATGSGKLEPVGEALKHSSPLQAIAFSPDGRQFATATHMNTRGVQLWDASTRNPGPYLAHPDFVREVAFSPDSRLIATAAFDKHVWMWDAMTGAPFWAKPLAFAGNVGAMAFSPDGKVLVTGGEDHQVHVWDVPTGKPLLKPLPHDSQVMAVAFHPLNSQLLMTAEKDGIVKFWNVQRGEVVQQRYQGSPLSLAKFTPNGQMLLTGGPDGVTRVWSLTNGLEVEKALLHDGANRSLTVSVSSRWAATANDDGTGRLWAIRAGRPIGRHSRHNPFAMCAVIDSADRWVATGGSDGTVQLRKGPAEVAGKPEDITNWVQALTGVELDSRGNLHSLGPKEWRQRQTALEKRERPVSD